MKNINILAIGLLLSAGNVYAQTTSQTVQQAGQVTTQPAGNRVQNVPVQPRQAGSQRVQSVQQRSPSTPAGQQVPTSTGQTQPIDQVPQSVETVNTTVDQQTQVIPEGQVQTTTTVPNSTTTIQETTTTIPQPANNGQVPKVYTNTQEQLPFKQYQPKPTGQISPSRNPVNRSTPRVR